MPTPPQVIERVEVLSDSVYTDVADAAFEYASYAAAAARVAVELSQSESTDLTVLAVPLSGQELSL